MSMYGIDPKKTKEFKNRGVTWWSNPAVNVIISCKGDVERADGRPIKKYSKNDGFNPKFGVSFPDSGTYSLRSFNSLFVRMVKGCEYGMGKQLMKVNENLEYSDKNTRIVSKGVLRLTQADIDCEKDDVKECEEKTNVHTHKHYRVIKGVIGYMAEDGAVFPTKDSAQWHQDNVTKGKSNAQIVLDYNSGYVLAEQLFMQEVVYRTQKPYVNFVDVMNNNNGVQEVNNDDVAVFDLMFAKLCRTIDCSEIKWVDGYKCSIKEAENLNSILIDFYKNKLWYAETMVKLDEFKK